MDSQVKWFSTLLCSSLFLAGCGGTKPAIKNKVPLTAVTGKILVDGQPMAGVFIQHIPLSATAETRPEYNEVIDTSGDQGQFSLHTYEPNDGIPAGEYGLTFMFMEANSKSHTQLLASDFTNRANPFKKFKVEKGAPLNLGDIELKTIQSSELKN